MKLITKLMLCVFAITGLMTFSLNTLADNSQCKLYDAQTFEQLLKRPAADLLTAKQAIESCQMTQACSRQPAPYAALCASQLSTQDFRISLAWRDAVSKTTPSGSGIGSFSATGGFGNGGRSGDGPGSFFSDPKVNTPAYTLAEPKNQAQQTEPIQPPPSADPAINWL